MLLFNSKLESCQTYGRTQREKDEDERRQKNTEENLAENWSEYELHDVR